MSEVFLKLLGKLNSVKIVSGTDAKFDDVDPFPKIEKFGFDNFDDLIFKPIKKQKKSIRVKKKNVHFYEEHHVITPTEPIRISLDKINKNYMSLSEVQVEIQQAYDKGFDDGQQMTRKTFEIELQKRNLWILNFEKLTNDLRTQFTSELVQLEEAVVPISKIIAEKILEREVSVDAEIILTQVKKAINTLDHESIFKIRIHPYNLEILETLKNELFTDKSKIEKVEITSDEAIGQGSCILETSAGRLDASFKAQLDKITETLLFNMPGSSSYIEDTIEETNEDVSDDSNDIEEGIND